MSFLKDRSGNFGIMTALLAVPLLVATGVATDYGMMTRSRSMLQDSLDAGLLAAGLHNGTLAERGAIAKDYVMTHADRYQMTDLVVDVRAAESGRGLVATATGNYEPFLVRFPGVRLYPISVSTEVAQGTDTNLDIALVLDNTASLGATGLSTVKAAAQSFRTTIFNAAPDPARVQMAVVPFAGAVNVGRDFPRSMLDVNGDARWHGVWLEDRGVARIGVCGPIDWGPPGDPGPGQVESWLRSVPSKIQQAFDEVLGIKSVNASPQDHGLPPGYRIETFQNCDFLKSPVKVNNFELFDRIPNVSWGGCVEARADGFDTTDRPATSGNADSLYVPYFWPDENDPENGGLDYVNNYMPDVGPTMPWTPASWATIENWAYGYNTFKYNGSNINLNGNSPYTYGPNRGCPQPLRPLTSNQPNINAAISGMTLVNGGGTVVSEGVAWGWRVLSPAAPFTQGRPAENTRRTMVIMSDGENQLSRNPQNAVLANGSSLDTPTLSDYNAYGYMRDARLGRTYAEFEAEIDRRTLETCQNARNDGIEIYTVLFQSTNSRAADILRQCATKSDNFYLATDAEALNLTFAAIAASIGRYRLVK